MSFLISMLSKKGLIIIGIIVVISTIIGVYSYQKYKINKQLETIEILNVKIEEDSKFISSLQGTIEANENVYKKTKEDYEQNIEKLKQNIEKLKEYQLEIDIIQMKYDNLSKEYGNANKKLQDLIKDKNIDNLTISEIAKELNIPEKIEFGK